MPVDIDCAKEKNVRRFAVMPLAAVIALCGLLPLIAFTGLRSILELGGAPRLVERATLLHLVELLAGVAVLALMAHQLYRLDARRRREQELFQGILDQLPDGILTRSERGEIQFSNKAYRSLRRQYRGCPDVDGELVLVRLQDAEDGLAEATVRDENDGVHCTAVLSGAQIRNEGGARVGVMIRWRDVTAQAGVERNLRELTARHREVAGAMTEALFVRNREGVITEVNSSAIRVLGGLGSEGNGKGLLPNGWRLLAENGAPYPGEGCPSWEALRTGIPRLGVKARIQTPEGERRWIVMNSVPIIETGGDAPLGVVTTCTDTTAQQDAIEAFERCKQELEEAQRLAGIGSWTWRIADDKMTWSPELFRLFGRNSGAGAVEYASQEQLYVPGSWRKLAAALGLAQQTGEPFELELELIREDGLQAWAVARGEAERDESGQIAILRGTLQDVTARRQLEISLREARERADAATEVKSAFLANMSHAIRTPMTGIVGMTALLLQTQVTGELRDCLETVRSSSEALLAILNDVLDFSKLEGGTLELERVPFELERMVEDTVDVVAESASQKGLELRFYVSGELPGVVVGDSLRLRQILLNLLSNAIKFTERGSVMVLVEPANEELAAGIGVRFTVSDTGPGLSDEQLKGYADADGARPRMHGGIGLGLGISQRLAKLMGGTSGVQSLPGEGSTFWFTAKLGASTIPLPAPLADASLQDRRVLVVGNQPMSLLLVRQQLESLGMRMVTARSEAEACAAVEPEMTASLQFAAALVDSDMAGTDPIELSRRMRARGSADVLPVVFMAAVRDQNLMTEAEGMGSTAFLMKPLRKTSLTRALCRLIRPAEGSELRAHAGLPALPYEVLLAEDNSTNQKVAMMMLKRFGCRTDAVGNGEEALVLLREKRYDLILMDCQMPVMDGWETAAAIRALEQGQTRVPILALTANALSGDKERCLEAGMDDYLAKPLSLVELHSQLTKWLSPPTTPDAV